MGLTVRRAGKRPPRISAVQINKGICRRCFTLIELVATILIILVTLTVTSVALRSRSSASRQLESYARDMSNFLSRVRINAAETGEEHIVVYIPESRELAAIFTIGEEEENEEELEQEELLGRREKNRNKLKKIRWRIPENVTLLVKDVEIDSYSPGQNLELDSDGTAISTVGPDEEELFQSRAGDEAGGVELLRVYPDGGSGGERKLVLTSGENGEYKIYLTISRLPGMASITDKAPDEEVF